MPRSSLDHYVDPARAKDIQHLADVAAKLQITTDAFSYRLMNLRRIDEPTWPRLPSLRRSDDQEIPNLFLKAFVRKLHVALDKGRVSTREAQRHEACL